jgi:hypothetical protein
MTKQPELPHDSSLSEDTAHRVLARAVELDARHASEVPLKKLREIAQEADISERALDQALREINGPGIDTAAGVEPDTRLLSSSDFAPLLRNLGSFAAALVIISAASRMASAFGAGWPVEHAIAIVANVLGVGLSLRFRAKLSAFMLAVTAVAQLAEYPMHLMFGIQTVQGGATKWALIVAAGLGISLGVLSKKASKWFAPTHPEPDLTIQADAAPGTTSEQSRSLLLRTT